MHVELMGVSSAREALETTAPLIIIFIGLPVVLYLGLMLPDRKAEDVPCFYRDYE
jgi:hypothetical protein